MFKSAIFFIFFYLLGIQLGFAATAKTIEGDCSSSDKSKQFKTKTYIDLDDDGSYDYLVTRWCNDVITKTKLKIIFPGGSGEFSPADVPIHQFDYLNFEEGSLDCQFAFLLREELDGPILAVEQKEFSNDTCFIYVLVDNIFGTLDEATRKAYPLGVFNSEKRMYINEIYLKEAQKVMISIEQEQGETIKVKELDGKEGWNLFFFKVPAFIRNGKFYLQVKTQTGEFDSTVPITLN